MLQVKNILRPTHDNFNEGNRDMSTWQTLYAFAMHETAEHVYDLGHSIWPDAAVVENYPQSENVAAQQYSIGNENPAHGKKKAFDGNLTNTTDNYQDFGTWYCWNGTHVNTGWIGQNFGPENKQNIAQYRVHPRNSTDRAPDPKDWTFEASDDNFANTVTLDTQTNQTFTQGEWNEYEINNSTSYQYYRINISANNGNPTYLLLQELEMMEGPSANVDFGGMTIQTLTGEGQAVNDGYLQLYVSLDDDGEYLPGMTLAEPSPLFIYGGDNADPANSALTNNVNWPVIVKPLPPTPTPTPAPAAHIDISGYDIDTTRPLANVTLTVTLANADHWHYKLDDGAEVMVMSGLSATFTAPEGPHQVTVYAIKVVDGTHVHEDEQSGGFVVPDITAPTATISGVPTSAIYPDANIILNIGGVDVTHYKFKTSWPDPIHGTDWSTEQLINVPRYWDLPWSLGTYIVEVIGRDAAGNWQATGLATTATWEVIAVPPTPTPVQPADCCDGFDNSVATDGQNDPVFDSGGAQVIGFQNTGKLCFDNLNTSAMNPQVYLFADNPAQPSFFGTFALTYSMANPHVKYEDQNEVCWESVNSQPGMNVMTQV